MASQQTPHLNRHATLPNTSSRKSATQHGFKRPTQFSRALQTPSTLPSKKSFPSSSVTRENDDINVVETRDDVDESPTSTRINADFGAGLDAVHDHDQSYSNVSAYQTLTRKTAAKRRKTSHYVAPSAYDTVSISSSGSSNNSTPDDRNIEAENKNDDPAEQNDEMLLANSPPSSPSSILQTPRITTSRFRNAYSQAHTSLTTQASPRLPSFISRIRHAHPERGPHPALDYTLPEAFSPSKRRGKGGTEYLHGGSVETVRRWILEVAGRGGSGADQVVLKVDRVIGVGDGRVAVVEGRITQHSGDDFAEEVGAWMLIDSENQLHRHGEGKLDLLKAGVEVLLKGGDAMRWTVPLGPGGSSCTVAVLWDVVQ